MSPFSPFLSIHVECGYYATKEKRINRTKKRIVRRNGKVKASKKMEISLIAKSGKHMRFCYSLNQ